MSNIELPAEVFHDQPGMPLQRSAEPSLSWQRSEPHEELRSDPLSALEQLLVQAEAALVAVSSAPGATPPYAVVPVLQATLAGDVVESRGQLEPVESYLQDASAPADAARTSAPAGASVGAEAAGSEARAVLRVSDTGGDLHILLGVALPESPALAAASGASSNLPRSVVLTASSSVSGGGGVSHVPSVAAEPLCIVSADPITAARLRLAELSGSIHASAMREAAVALQSFVRRRFAKHHAERRASAEMAARAAEERAATLAEALRLREAELTAARLGERERAEAEQRQREEALRALEAEARAREAAELVARDAHERVAAMEAQTSALQAALVAQQQQIDRIQAEARQEHAKAQEERHGAITDLDQSRHDTRVRATVRLQRFVRRRALRALWLETIDDAIGYERLRTQLRRARAAAKVQRWWHRRTLRLHWVELIADLTVNAELKQRRRQHDAVYRLQSWYRRRVMRTQWYAIVGMAKARRQLRALRAEQRRLEGERRERSAVLVQSRYRGTIGRWLARAKKSTDERVYVDLVSRREEMLERHRQRFVARQEAAARWVQSHYRGKLLRQRMKEMVAKAMRVQRFVRHLRTRRKWVELLQQLASYATMVARREAILRRFQQAAEAVTDVRRQAAVRLQRWVRRLRQRNTWYKLVHDAVALDQILQKIRRELAATKLQRWCRSVYLTRRWHVLVTDVQLRAAVARRGSLDKVALSQLQSAARGQHALHLQAGNQLSAHDRLPRTSTAGHIDPVATASGTAPAIVPATDTIGAAVRLQRWWHRRAMRLHWVELVEVLSINAMLRRRRQQHDAVYRLQSWYRRRVMRAQWYQMVEMAKARRQLRTLRAEQRKIEARRREAAAVVVQSRYRGGLGRSLARARRETDDTGYFDLVHRREQMLQRHRMRLAVRREEAARWVQSHYRGKLFRQRMRQAVAAVLRVQRFVRHLRTRRRWAELLQQIGSYATMARRREVVLRRAAARQQRMATSASRLQVAWRKYQRRRELAAQTDPFLLARGAPPPAAAAVRRRSSSSIFERDAEMAAAAATMQAGYRGALSRRSNRSSDQSASPASTTFSNSLHSTPQSMPRREPRTLASDAPSLGNHSMKRRPPRASAAASAQGGAAVASTVLGRLAELPTPQLPPVAAHHPAQQAAVAVGAPGGVRTAMEGRTAPSAHDEAEARRKAQGVARRKAEAKRLADDMAAVKARRDAEVSAQRREQEARVAEEERSLILEAEEVAAREREARIAAEAKAAALAAELARVRSGRKGGGEPASDPSAATPPSPRGAAVRLQRFVRRRALRALWLETIDDAIGYERLRTQLRRARAAAKVQRWWHRRTLRLRWVELIDDAMDYHRLIVAVRAASAASQAQREGTAATVVQSHLRRLRVQAEEAEPRREARRALEDEAREYAELIDEVRRAVASRRAEREAAAAARIQARVRQALARVRVDDLREGRAQQIRDAAAYEELIEAVRRRVAIDAAERSARRVEAATAVQAHQRGKIGRHEAAHAQRMRALYGPRAVGATELRQASQALARVASRLPVHGYGVCQLGATLSRSELDELLFEAATDHALTVHELGVPVAAAQSTPRPEHSPPHMATPTAGSMGGRASAIRPLLIFDSSLARAEPAERVFPLDLETAGGRRRALLRQEMRGLTIARESRALLSRPPHKLWAIGERRELRAAEEAWILGASSSVDREGTAIILLERLAGELVHFWELDGQLHAATRQGRTPAASHVESHLASSPVDYAGMAHCAIAAGLTPIFMWCPPPAAPPPPMSVTPARRQLRLPPSPANMARSPADGRARATPGSYASPRLVLVALRHMTCGLYAPHVTLERVATRYGVPVVRRLATWTPPPGASLAEAVEHLHALAIAAIADAARRQNPTAWPPAVGARQVSSPGAAGMFGGASVPPPPASGLLDLRSVLLTNEAGTFLAKLSLDRPPLLPIPQSRAAGARRVARELLPYHAHPLPPDGVGAGGLAWMPSPPWWASMTPSANIALLVEVSLSVACSLDDLHRLGGPTLCARLATEMRISPSRLHMRAARLVRPGLLPDARSTDGDAAELSPSVEALLEVLPPLWHLERAEGGDANGSPPWRANSADGGGDYDDGDFGPVTWGGAWSLDDGAAVEPAVAAEPAAAVAAAVLLGCTRRRLELVLGVTLNGLPTVRTELPPALRTARSSDADADDKLLPPLPSLPAVGTTYAATPLAPPLGKDAASELTEALRVVHAFAIEWMGIALPSKPPPLDELLGSAASQAQLLQLLQAALAAAERIPSDGGTWSRERPSLIAATSALVLALQQWSGALIGGGGDDDGGNGGPPSQGLPTLANRALGALCHTGRAVDDAMGTLAHALAAASTEAKQRAWSGVARPEACRVRTFVRLRPPSTFEILWARRSKRIAWGTRYADIRPPQTTATGGSHGGGSMNASPSSAASATPVSTRLNLVRTPARGTPARGTPARGTPARAGTPGSGGGNGTRRVQLTEVFEPGASQQRVYSNVLEPLVSGVLDGLDCALLCVGATGTGKTYTLHGTELARADPLSAPRDEWGIAMRACEALLQRAAPHALGTSLAASAGSGAHFDLTFVEVDGDEVFDLLRNGTPLTLEIDTASGTPRPSGAAQMRITSLEDAAYALRVGLRAANRGVLAPRTHTILTLTVAQHGSAGSQQRRRRLVLADLASGDLHAPYRYASSPNRPAQSTAARSLAVLGACVAARADGGPERAVPWREATLALLLRETLSGEFCTAVLGGCGAAEADVHGTISTLQFLMHAGGCINRVRVPQPPLESLVRRLRALDERRAIEQQRWVESPPPMLQATGLAGRPLSSSLAVSSDGGGAVATSPPATGGMPEEAAAPPEIESFDQLAAQLSLTLNLRDEQAAMLRGHAREIKAAIAESARERRSLPWDEDAALGAAGGLGGARDVLQALEQLGRQVDVLDTWVREAQDTHQQLRRAIALRAPPDLLEGEDVYTEPVDARLLHPTLRATRPSQQV